MLLLHAGELGGHLMLWGETDAETGRRDAKSHPFGAELQDIVAAVKSIGIQKPDRHHEVDIWAPTAGAKPIPSSSMLKISAKSVAKPKMRPWTVQALQLSAGDAGDVLAAAAGRRTISPGVAVSPDLAFWTDARRLAGSLVARGQFLPDMSVQKIGHMAVWRPALVGTDAQRFADLAGRMPPACRAIYHKGDKEPPHTAPRDALRRVVAGMVDHMVRAAALRAYPGGTRTRKHFDSVHDAWLHALRARDNIIPGDADSLEDLAGRIAEWRRPVSVPAESHFRLCFRLEEPHATKDAAGDNRWYVRYMLQPRDDPSLLVPADKVWDSPGGILERSGPNAREFLLVSLGQASGICPGIAGDGGLGGHALDASGAHGFLSTEAGALEQAGYGVMLPAWWTGKGTKTRLKARAHAAANPGAGGILSLYSIVRFDWRVAVGDQTITAEELEELARTKSPLVKIRGQWVEVGSQEIRAALELLRERGNEATMRDMIRMELGGEGAPKDIKFGGVAATGGLADVLDRLDGKTALQETDPPAGLSGTLRPYQARGYSWLWFLQRWGLGGCLADDMGLGKTIQVLAAIQRFREEGGEEPVLVVCPTSVMDNWRKEAARFTPELDIMIHHGSSRSRGKSFAASARNHAAVVCSYGLLQRDVKFIGDVKWGGVVLDEAQNIKNPRTKQAQAARSLNAECRFALTGTPVENSVADLWSVMEFLNPGFLGTQEWFRREFLLPIQAGADAGAADRLRRATGPFILRRLKTDKSIISDLPEKMEMKVFCTLTREQASLYSAVLKEGEKEMQSSEGIRRKGVILALLSKLKQVCNHPAHFLGDNSGIPGRSGKLDRLTEMLDEVIQAKDRALVFTQFTEMGHILVGHLQEAFGQEVPFLHGGVSRGKRAAMVDDFQDGKHNIFVISLKAGGTGLNLTAANHVFHFDRWWNPSVENQATDRAFRIGQDRNVQVHKMMCAGTMEERIDDIIERKRQVAESTVGSGEGWLANMSNDDLRDVLSLSREAVGA